MTSSTRRAVFAAYGISYTPASGLYELDHLIPLELGGDNTASNLWPEPYHGTNSADVKDHLENRLHALVCDQQVGLREAQQAFAGNWLTAAVKYDALPPTKPAPVRTEAVPVHAAPATTTPVPAAPTSTAESFATCREMNGTYPHGVGLPGAVDHTSAIPVTNFYRSTDLYNAYRSHDADNDGIACERR